ncbi:hypothetical protein MiAbW_03190 [Microcystis aeruginosa NIES-4325]|uniref:Uncharacterized protein n=1 Tax=Microcystis aeruginosa NIES-4325 TaxID=2569534 RepID=A0A5J4FD56_MICAE|nr:hypothetical protein MiAbW_03190 [Microcystis aeruginosa NIES-4325]
MSAWLKLNFADNVFRATILLGNSCDKYRMSTPAIEGILAGLVLNRETIKKIPRSDIMRESVIYQDILEEGEEKGLQKGKEEKAR